MVEQALSAENQRVVPPEPIIAPPHPFDKPSLLKDCNVSYSNSSRPLAEQGERQEAFGKVLSEEEMGIGYDRIAGPAIWFGKPKPGLIYTTPQPGPDVRGLVSADDVRDACANAVSVFAEVTNADQCREVAEYMREVLLAQIARRATSGKERKE